MTMRPGSSRDVELNLFATMPGLRTGPIAAGKRHYHALAYGPREGTL